MKETRLTINGVFSVAMVDRTTNDVGPMKLPLEFKAKLISNYRDPRFSSTNAVVAPVN